MLCLKCCGNQLGGSWWSQGPSVVDFCQKGLLNPARARKTSPRGWFHPALPMGVPLWGWSPLTGCAVLPRCWCCCKQNVSKGDTGTWQWHCLSQRCLAPDSLWAQLDLFHLIWIHRGQRQPAWDQVLVEPWPAHVLDPQAVGRPAWWHQSCPILQVSEKVSTANEAWPPWQLSRVAWDALRGQPKPLLLPKGPAASLPSLLGDRYLSWGSTASQQPGHNSELVSFKPHG